MSSLSQIGFFSVFLSPDRDEKRQQKSARENAVRSKILLKEIRSDHTGFLL